MSPEQKLTAAVLRRAIEDGDVEWVASDATDGYTYTFLGCCEALHLDPRRVRSVLTDGLGRSGVLRLLDKWAVSQGQRTHGAQVGRRFKEDI